MINLLGVLLLAANEPQVEAIQEALRAAKAPLHRCWEQAAADDWHVSGKVSLAITVGAKQNQVRVTGDETRKTGLADCAAAAFVHARLSGLSPGDSVELPVVFKAEPNVTVRSADVTPVKVGKLTARVLIDKQSAGAEKASLSLVEIPGGAMLAGYRGVTYDLTTGEAHWGYTTIAPKKPSKILVLFAPPGHERELRKGQPIEIDAGSFSGSTGAGGENEYPIAGGLGRVKMLIEMPDAYLGTIKLQAGVAVPEHAHAKEAEILYVLAGTGELTVDGETYPVEPQMAIHIPPGAKHSFKALSAVEAVQFYAPSGPEQRFKDQK